MNSPVIRLALMCFVVAPFVAKNCAYYFLWIIKQKSWHICCIWMLSIRFTRLWQSKDDQYASTNQSAVFNVYKSDSMCVFLFCYNQNHVIELSSNRLMRNWCCNFHKVAKYLSKTMSKTIEVEQATDKINKNSRKKKIWKFQSCCCFCCCFSFLEKFYIELKRQHWLKTTAQTTYYKYIRSSEQTPVY